MYFLEHSIFEIMKMVTSYSQVVVVVVVVDDDDVVVVGC